MCVAAIIAAVTNLVPQNFTEPRKMKRRGSAGLSVLLIAVSLLAAILTLPPSAADNVDVDWDDENESPVNIPFARWVVNSDNAMMRFACAQPVKLTTPPPSVSVTAVGIAVGQTACTPNGPSPCDMYDGVVSCEPIGLFGVDVIPLEADATITDAELELGCIKPMRILIDADGDGEYNFEIPGAGFSGCTS